MLLVLVGVSVVEALAAADFLQILFQPIFRMMHYLICVPRSIIIWSEMFMPLMVFLLPANMRLPLFPALMVII